MFWKGTGAGLRQVPEAVTSTTLGQLMNSGSCEACCPVAFGLLVVHGIPVQSQSTPVPNAPSSELGGGGGGGGEMAGISLRNLTPPRCICPGTSRYTFMQNISNPLRQEVSAPPVLKSTSLEGCLTEAGCQCHICGLHSCTDPRVGCRSAT